MKGRFWLVLGASVGVVAGILHVAYLSGAASALSDTAVRVVGSGALSIVHTSGVTGSWHRVVQGVAALLEVLVPGLLSLCLVAVARLTLYLRVLVGVAVLALGCASFIYLGTGTAFGVLAVALLAAGLAVMASGLLFVAPLALVAGLIGATFLPRLVTSSRSIPGDPVRAMHHALFASGGSPLWLAVLLLAAAAIPFALALRLIVR